MTLVRVEPLDFAQAADNYHAIGVNVLTRLSVMHGRLRRYARMAGDDPGGVAFAEQYDAAAAAILTAVDKVATQATNFDRAIAASGILHASAESGASLGTVPGASFGLRPERAESCPAPPASALGGDGSDPPEPWSMVKDFIGMMWPNANTADLRSAATAWEEIADDLNQIATEILRADDPLKRSTSGEIDAISRATFDFHTDVRALSDGCDEIATGVRGYADDVDDMHAEVFRMLAQLAIEIAASIGIGVALSFVTFGATGAAAAGVVAARIVMVAGRIVALITRVSSTAARVAARIASIHARLLSVISKVGSGGQAWIRVGIDVTAGTAGALISEGTVRGDQANYLVAGVGGFIGGGATAGILAGFARRADTLLANVLAGAGGGLTGAVGEGVVMGRIDPASLALGTIMGAGGGGLGTFGRAGTGIAGFHAGRGGDAGPVAGPDGGAPHVPDGVAPDGSAVDLAPPPRTAEAPADVADGPASASDGTPVVGPGHVPAGAGDGTMPAASGDGPAGGGGDHSATTTEEGAGPTSAEEGAGPTGTDDGGPAATDDGGQLAPSPSDGSNPDGAIPDDAQAFPVQPVPDPPPAVPFTPEELAQIESPNYATAVFGSRTLEHYLGPEAFLGGPRQPDSPNSFFSMFGPDAAAIRTPVDALRFAGYPDSVVAEFGTWRPDGMLEPRLNPDGTPYTPRVYGVSYPVAPEMFPRGATAADAGPNPHFLPGGNTAVLTESSSPGLMINHNIHEFVIDTHTPMPQGGYLWALGANGERIALRRF